MSRHHLWAEPTLSSRHNSRSWNERSLKVHVKLILCEGLRLPVKYFCKTLPEIIQGFWEHVGLVLPFFHNLESKGIQLQGLSPWRHNSFEVYWQNANKLLSHADPALALLWLLRTSRLAATEQWFHCFLLTSLPCSSFSALHLHRQNTVQDLTR